VPLELTPDLAPELVPLAWLVGRWEGVGVVGYPTMQEAQFGQEVEFAHDGRPFLHYTSRTWLLDADGRQVRPLAAETGFWRPAGEPAADAHGGADGPRPAADAGTEVELLLTHPMGYVEMYVGRAAGARVELATDMVARTPTAKEYTDARRMYGLVEGDLLWVMDMAAVGQELQSHASARLRRV
jgi:THAP4-like, heme-binding beta-barrel domain